MYLKLNAIFQVFLTNILDFGCDVLPVFQKFGYCFVDGNEGGQMCEFVQRKGGYMEENATIVIGEFEFATLLVTKGHAFHIGKPEANV